MAGDWIKLRVDLRDDPAVFKIAEKLNIDDLTVIGGLFCFWAWADKHSVDGRVDGATSRLVDRVSCLPGFSEALVSVGWLVMDESGACIPKFERHNGESAKERAQKNARQSRWRRKKSESVDGEASTDMSTCASTREEKRREEKNKEKDKGSTFVTPLWVDQQLWDDFIDMRKKIKKPATDRAKQLLINELQKLIEQGYSQQDVIGNSIRNGWQDFYAPKRMNGNNGGFVC